MDPGRREEILARYAAHVRRFEEARARRRPAGAAPCEPHQPAWSHRRTLTPREREVLALIGEGLDNPEIAERLVLSVETVKAHVKRILVKLEARNRAHAVALGIGTGIIPLPRAGSLGRTGAAGGHAPAAEPVRGQAAPEES